MTTTTKTVASIKIQKTQTVVVSQHGGRIFASKGRPDHANYALAFCDTVGYPIENDPRASFYRGTYRLRGENEWVKTVG